MCVLMGCHGGGERYPQVIMEGGKDDNKRQRGAQLWIPRGLQVPWGPSGCKSRDNHTTPLHHALCNSPSGETQVRIIPY